MDTAPIVIGSLYGAKNWETEVYHRYCAQCKRAVEIIKYGDMPPLGEEAQVLCPSCAANFYVN
jgi:hypothetical protein